MLLKAGMTTLRTGRLHYLGLMENPVSEQKAADECRLMGDATGSEEVPDSGVVVPDIDCPLDQAAIVELRMAVEPTAHSVSFGRDLMCVRHASYLAGRVHMAI